MSPEPVPFSKYDEMGAYHWAECDRNSPRYNPPLEARYTVVSRRIERAKLMLDVGCGDGYLMGRVRMLCDQVVGIDTEATGTRLASEKLRPFTNCATVQASCYHLPFQTEQFEIVTLADVIEHLESPAACLEEITRVLRPDGALLLTTPKWRPDRKWDPRHVKEYTPDELAESLRPYFSRVTMSYFWPIRWSRMYSTRIGWRVIRLFARHAYNPFLEEGLDPDCYGQILAVCEEPRREITHAGPVQDSKKCVARAQGTERGAEATTPAGE